MAGGNEIRLYVAQFNRSARRNDTPYDELPYHWELVISHNRVEKARIGDVFHIIGSTTEYGFEKKENIRFHKNGNWRGSLNVLTLTPAQRARVEQLLPQVPSVSNNPNWNCQHWVFDALKILEREIGFPEDYLGSFHDLFEKMADVWRTWDAAENPNSD